MSDEKAQELIISDQYLHQEHITNRLAQRKKERGEEREREGGRRERERLVA